MPLPDLRERSPCRRAARVLLAVALAGLTGGCQAVNDLCGVADNIGGMADNLGGMANNLGGAAGSLYASLYTRLFGEPQAASRAILRLRPPPPPAPVLADRVVVFKKRRLLELVRGGEVFASFPIALGPHPEGPKEQKGDGRTPEGGYTIDWESADTKYTGELHISYPDAADRARAAAMGVDPGGAIFIHGLPDDFGPHDPPRWYRDWTEGCIAVGNLAIYKIMRAVPVGTPIDILP
ncbi:MAG TPA: L,D-transpeptidase [Stellaceae bacterium]|nr:L,D-transpeptidase [Stellaceae bacterium]